MSCNNLGESSKSGAFLYCRAFFCAYTVGDRMPIYILLTKKGDTWCQYGKGLQRKHTIIYVKTTGGGEGSPGVSRQEFGEGAYSRQQQQTSPGKEGEGRGLTAF